MIRKPAVSGLFYESNPEQLKKTIENCFTHKLGIGKIPTLNKVNNKEDIENNQGLISIIAPHAGYVFSLPTASHSYYHLVTNGFPETFIIISPNHTGFGEEISVFNEGKWITPLGEVEVDSQFANKLIDNSNIAKGDYSAHIKEHGIEVQLPVLQYFSNDFKIVPIVISNQNPETSKDIAQSIIKTYNQLDTSISVIASTDLSHFNNQDIAISEDNIIIDDIKNMDEVNLFRDVLYNHITMCGYGPVMASILISKYFNKTAHILKHTSSGDISGDYSSVVGYCSGIFK